jgi:signal transduction histidine kinase/CheY-like chemotaxis protein
MARVPLRNILRYLLLSVLCLGCAVSDLRAEERPGIDRPLRIAIYTYPPLFNEKPDGGFEGLFYDLTEDIAEQNGWKREYIHGSWAQCLELLEKGEVDLFPAIAYTEERDKLWDYNKEIVMSSWAVMYAHKDIEASTIVELNRKRIGLLRGDLSAQDFVDISKRLGMETENIYYETLREQFDSLNAGRVDAITTTELHISSSVDSNIHPNVKKTPIIFAPITLQYAVPEGTGGELTARIDEYISQSRDNPSSKYNLIIDKWIGGQKGWRISKYIVISLSVAGAIAFIFVIMATILKFQVNRKTDQLEQAKAELENRVAERTRELSRSNEKLKAANKAKSLFLANMSHELRTPLNAILGFSRLLSREENTTASQQEKLSIINHSGYHLLSMINDVLDISKIEAGRVEIQEDTFNLAALIKEISAMIRSQAEEKHLSVSAETETVSFPFVKADVGKLRQILINLLDNAVKFTDRGEVTIRCSSEPTDESPNLCQIVIEVEDTGPGIDLERKAKIFEPFVREADESIRKGSGLGLSICQAYAHLMGGALEVESELGNGALFRLRLPAEITDEYDAATSAADKPRITGLASSQSTVRILVVDDNRENMLLLTSLLEEVGFSVLEASNGQEAVETFEKESPDFIWMDMRMPVMDGYEATSRIRSLPGGEAVKIVAITASAFKQQRSDILAAGCDEVVYKPFKDNEVFEVMAQLLDIEYRYEKYDRQYLYKEEGEEAARKERVDLTQEMLADLPGELLQELREATLALNREASLEVIARSAEHAPDTANDLQKLINSFQIGLIRDLLGENHEK